MKLSCLLLVLASVLATVAGFSAPMVARSIVATPVLSSSVFMGRGDKRTKKGKVKAGSYGNTRPHKAPLKYRLVKPASYVALQLSGKVAE
ncbi:hypothetical protein T492DRAFT_994420 [Pavlovales sp. CCMP2436]|nr:hypothetical protein T492DRAFT_994420 [Pavlovales sp. CCMP2436]|eukprot:CAMPEP_0179859880 /NCGR_PEP_ID=MMETSP0982-20121206/13279_1 /TAXON_ID=483367 /ORGANISM="non described non described, Strain CCMP 2436" /LENGTH=89 /DNA_ID=CAMNT_0021747015 /DNA_START=25 /DNA_END=294 /DNA_ORIENTATION=+